MYIPLTWLRLCVAVLPRTPHSHLKPSRRSTSLLIYVSRYLDIHILDVYSSHLVLAGCCSRTTCSPPAFAAESAIDISPHSIRAPAPRSASCCCRARWARIGSCRSGLRPWCFSGWRRNRTRRRLCIGTTKIKKNKKKWCELYDRRDKTLGKVLSMSLISAVFAFGASPVGGEVIRSVVRIAALNRLTLKKQGGVSRMIWEKRKRKRLYYSGMLCSLYATCRSGLLPLCFSGWRRRWQRRRPYTGTVNRHTENKNKNTKTLGKVLNRCEEKHSLTAAHHPVVKPPAVHSTAVSHTPTQRQGWGNY